MKPAARAAYVACLLFALAGAQVAAQAVQLSSGFRPLSHPPTRVALSWDMFAIKIDRCAVRWEPPITVDQRPVARWRDRTAPLEFDTVYNVARDWDDAALYGCGFREGRPTTVHVACATSDGEVRDVARFCP